MATQKNHIRAFHFPCCEGLRLYVVRGTLGSPANIRRARRTTKANHATQGMNRFDRRNTRDIAFAPWPTGATAIRATYQSDTEGILDRVTPDRQLFNVLRYV